MTDPHEGDALLRAVLERPKDDAPRLIYADWLEESETVSHGERWAQATYIRHSVANPEQEPEELQDFVKACPEANDWFATQTIHLKGIGLPVLWQRGFVDEVRCPLRTFLQHAEMLFSNYPITKVELVCRRPMRITEADLTRRIFWWIIAPPDRTEFPMRDDLPNWLRPFLNPLTEQENSISYRTEQDAFDDLSNACVAYYRQSAGLPSL